MSIRLFELLDGLQLRFWLEDRALRIAAGQYGGGRGAIQLLDLGDPVEGTFIIKKHGSAFDSVLGAVYDVLTKNLVLEKCAPDEFFVKVDEETTDTRRTLLATVEKLGIFERTGEVVASGYVLRYAERWRFAKHEGAYAIECPSCIAGINARYDEELTRRKARDTVNRLKGARQV